MVSSYQGHIQAPVREEYPCVGAFMSKSFVAVPPEMDVYHAMGILVRERVSGLLVVEARDHLLGIVSEKDLLKLCHRDSYSGNQTGGPVSAYMTTSLLTLTPDQGLHEAVEIFTKTPYKKLPVLEGGRLVGVVRRRDVLIVIEDFYTKQMKFLRHN